MLVWLWSSNACQYYKKKIINIHAFITIHFCCIAFRLCVSKTYSSCYIHTSSAIYSWCNKLHHVKGYHWRLIRWHQFALLSPLDQTAKHIIHTPFYFSTLYEKHINEAYQFDFFERASSRRSDQDDAANPQRAVTRVPLALPRRRRCWRHLALPRSSRAPRLRLS